MRMFTFFVLAAFLVGHALAAQEKTLPEKTPPLSFIMEQEAKDVPVCQDWICTKLREEILVEAAKCRPLASFKRRRMHVRVSRARNSCRLFHDRNFRMSKGKCSAAIRDACEKAGIDGSLLEANAYNLEKKGLLEKAGFVNMIWKYDEKSAPLGSLLVYEGGLGHRYGHVEVRVNPTLYCSDHCSDHPVTGLSAATHRAYKLVGVYLPFTASIQISDQREPASTDVN
jgi:hypothetical protein